jgi:crotonobetainyl-CoA:carnitine CoA-transferase CaiB-like acyl-CoA transferase
MRILSFCHYLQGPAATQYLADLGADVIKIEPLRGAFERHWSGGKSRVGRTTAFSLAVNRNKRSLALDLKHPKARTIMDRLIARTDAIVENFRPGVLDRLGYGYEAVRSSRPDIIYASATGLGADGPDARRPGQDLLMQARSGLVAATGAGPGSPRIVGAAVVDQHGAALLAMGVLGAFVSKLQTGRGTRVESSLFQAGIDLQAEALAMYFGRKVDGDVMQRGPNVGSWYHDAPYGSYALVDCSIVLSMNDPGKLAEALDSDELRALVGLDRYAERERYAAAVAAVLAPRRFADVAEALDRAGVWFERVQSYEDLAADRQARHLGAFMEIDAGGETARVVAHPMRYDGASPECRRMPLEPGCDDREILMEHGFTSDEIRAFRDEGVIAAEESSAGRSDEAKERSNA